MNITFLHGLGQTPQSWEKTASYLPESVTADCIDLFHLCAETTYPALYQAFAQRCGTAPLHLCGLSLGAILALDFAVRHSGQVRSLTLIAPQYKMPRLLLGIQNLIFRFLPEKAFVETGLAKQDILRLTSSMTALDFRQKVQQVTCPTLIMYGEKDSANQKAAQEREEN